MNDSPHVLALRVAGLGGHVYTGNFSDSIKETCQVLRRRLK